MPSPGPGSRDAWEAFHEVSALEGAIAVLVPPDDIEGRSPGWVR